MEWRYIPRFDGLLLSLCEKKLYDGTPLENIEEYHSLKGCDAEQDSLRLLSEWLEEKRHK